MSRRNVPDDFSRAARVVAVGASAGGIEALLALLPLLPAGYPLAVVVVLHLPEKNDSVLAELFAARCAVSVREAMDKETIAAGHVYFAPPGYHLLVEADHTFALSCDAPERFSRPSIDVLFQSAADVLGASLVAVLLTGANDDGARGIAHTSRCGGLTVVQDPARAQAPQMPAAAIAMLEPDFILPLEEIGKLLTLLEHSP